MSKKYNLLFPTAELPDLPDEELPNIPGPSEISAKRQEKKSCGSSFDASESLFSTLDGESSAVLTLNPPTKRTKLSDVTFSSSEEDEILGNIQPYQNSKTNYLQKEDPNVDPGSPLDRSTPISDCEEEETQVFSVNNNPQSFTKQNNNIVSAETTPSTSASAAASSTNTVPSESASTEPTQSSTASRQTSSRPMASPPVNPRFR